MRASLLLNCSQKEADEVRKRAKLLSRTVSAYIVRIVMRAVSLSEDFDKSFKAAPLYWERHARKKKSFRPRTTLHVYCSAEEAQRIRHAAQVRATTISGFVLRSLHRCWLAEEAVLNKMYRSDT
jgi:hypothetical protein